MDYQENIMNEMSPDNQYARQKQSSNSMATASLVMGILALLGCCFCGGFLFGGLGILFALLSRTGEHMEGRARAGMILSIIALVCALLAIAGLMALALSDGVWGQGSIRQLPAYPEIPDFTLPDNMLRGFWRGGGYL